MRLITEFYVADFGFGTRLYLVNKNTKGQFLGPADALHEEEGITQDVTIERTKGKYWSIELDEYPIYRDKVGIKIPEKVLGILREPVKSVRLDEVKERIGDRLFTYLKGYQREGVARIIGAGGRMMLADEMGLGKTIQATASLLAFPESRPVIIASPSSVKDHWAHTIREWVTDDVEVMANGKQKLTASVRVVSYDMMANVIFTPKKIKAAEKLLKNTYGSCKLEDVKKCIGDTAVTSEIANAVRIIKNGDNSSSILDAKFVILDESHYAKNLQATRTKAAIKVCLGAERAILISGTPLNQPKNLFSQFLCMRDTLYPFFKYTLHTREFTFVNRYCAPKQEFIGGGRKTWSVKGAWRLPELNQISKRYMIRRLKKGVLKDLPKKTRERVIVHTFKGELDMSKLDAIKEEKGHLMASAEFMDMVRTTCAEKRPFVIKYLKEVMLPLTEEQPDLKVILFGHHGENLDAVEAVLPKGSYIRIDGSTASHKRQPMVDQFQTDPKVRFAVLSIAATATGLTMTAATLVIFTELRFNPDTAEQAEARAHRIGQDRPVTIRYLVTEGKSTDPILWNMLNNKMDVASKAMDNVGRRMGAKTKRIQEPEKPNE